MDRGAWQATVHEPTKSQTQLITHHTKQGEPTHGNRTKLAQQDVPVLLGVTDFR